MMTRMVDGASPSPDGPFVGAGLDTGAGWPFVQERLALLGKTVFLLAFGFFVVINALFVVAGGVPLVPLLLQQHNVMHFLSASDGGSVGPHARAPVVRAHARHPRRRVRAPPRHRPG